MEERKKRILEAIIEDYINRVEPVGSEALLRNHYFSVSPATIRNQMSDLEKEGYLLQPHISAGRIPSDKGYRFYIDHIMQEEVLTENEKVYIGKEFSNISGDLEEIIEHTLKILSHLSNLVTFFTSPRVSFSSIKLIQLLYLNVQRVLIILLTNARLFDNFVLKTQNDFTQEDLNLVSNFLTEKLNGLTLRMIDENKMYSLICELPQYKELIEGTLGFAKNCEELMEEEKVYISGAAQVMNQPEFKDPKKAQMLMEIIEEEKLFLSSIADVFAQDEELIIKIGKENKVPQMQECSLVVSSYKSDEAALGAFGIIGPTRMQYARLTSIVQKISEILCRKFEEEKV